jgi:hypothetical protein
VRPAAASGVEAAGGAGSCSGDGITLACMVAHGGRRGGKEVGRRSGGIGLGGILVILGIVLAIVWSFWWGLIIGVVGLVFFGGFARGKWY